MAGAVNLEAQLMSRRPVAQGRLAEQALGAVDIVKRFGPTQALAGASIELKAGAVHGLVGANGAGKSTLMRILVGELKADSGELVVGGQPQDLSAWQPARAGGLGIRLIHQEVPLFDNLSVLEHYGLSASQAGVRFTRRELEEVCAQELEKVFPSARIRLRATVAELPFHERQIVEITRAVLFAGLSVLILDEPTSGLPNQHVEELEVLLERLRNDGVAVVFVSHRLGEIEKFCQHITVLRDGNVAAVGDVASFDEARIVSLMSGDATVSVGPTDLATSGQASAAPSYSAQSPSVVEVTGMGSRTYAGVNIAVKAGEVVGLSGLAGSGQREVVHDLLFGNFGRAARITSFPKTRALVTGERRHEGVLPAWSVGWNISFSVLRSITRFGIVSRSAERRLIDKWISDLGIRTQDADGSILSLSGGNQQKAVIARALATEPELLLLDDPTRGVDVSTKQQFYRTLRHAKEGRKAVLWYSTDDEEMLQCDRVYVMREGQIINELEGDAISREAVVQASFSVDPGAPKSLHGLPTGISTRLAGLAKRGWLLAGLALFAMIVLIAVTNGSALLPGSGLPILVGSYGPLTLAAPAEMLIIGQGDIDLGIGSFVGLTNVISATLLVTRPLLGVVALLASIFVYAMQGWIVAVRRVPSIIVTIAMAFVWLGVALWIQPSPAGASPHWLDGLLGIGGAWVPAPIWIAVVLGILVTVFLFRTRPGVVIRATGNSPSGVMSLGRSPVRAKVTAYLAAGALAAAAGLATTSLTGGSDANASQPVTLLAIAAVILGGSSFIGGFIDPVGAVVGAWVFSILGSLLGLLEVNPTLTPMIEGIVLLLILGLRLSLARASASAGGAT